MIALVSGGAASGKSEFAEALALRLAGERPRYYVAAMEVFDEESRRRVLRHRQLRRGKGFLTLEHPRELSGLALPREGVALVECMSNLLANECFGTPPSPDPEQAAVEGMLHLAQQGDVVVVTNELFSDGLRYDPSTEEYLKMLGRVNQALARQASLVYEVVCGIPLCRKDTTKEGLSCFIG